MRYLAMKQISKKGNTTNITIPKYEPDDSPLSNEDIKRIREDAKASLPTGRVVSSKTLLF